MRKVDINEIVDNVERLCKDANYYLNADVTAALNTALKQEVSPIGREVLKTIINNAQIARKESIAICQDTGMVVVFMDIGQQVTITGDITGGINEGIRRAYKTGYLRKSVVGDPIIRENTSDNTPAVIHYNIVPGEKIKITVVPKGFGSENMSALKMLSPSDGIEGIKEFVIETVDKSGANPCPPIVVGVGIGGTMEKAALLSKKALIRQIDIRSELQHIKDLEKELLEEINNLGIGPAGLGGKTTALAVNIEVYPTHIAALPIAVNLSCHALRHAEVVI